VDEGFLIGLYLDTTPQKIADWLNQRGVRSTLTVVWKPDVDRTDQVLASVRVDFDDPADELRHGDALRRWTGQDEDDWDVNDEAPYYSAWPWSHELAEKQLLLWPPIRTGPEE
jgi:hypothetical protein